MIKTSSELFRAVKESISTPNKWTKFSLVDRDGKRCLLGALNLHRPLLTSPQKKEGGVWYELHLLENMIEKFFEEKYPGSVMVERRFDRDIYSTHAIGAVVDFNDRIGTTHADVMEVLDRTIKKAEEEENNHHENI